MIWVVSLLEASLKLVRTSKPPTVSTYVRDPGKLFNLNTRKGLDVEALLSQLGLAIGSAVIDPKRRFVRFIGCRLWF